MASNPAKTEQITFYRHWLPTLALGAHSVSVTPDLEADGEALETSPVTETFYVGGPRYALTDAEVYACYPATDQVGPFFDTLPHVVFDRCTLPWERTIDGADPTVEHAPWLALILLTDADFSDEPTVEEQVVPPIVPRTLAEVLEPEDQVVGPSFDLAPYEDKTDPCRTIDLPASVFSAVLPRQEDLSYLAHVREVETDNKETWSLLKEGKFSVVICHRFPETQAVAGEEKDWGIANTMCLVSLEGWGEYLSDPDRLDADERYRLLVLGAWRFICQGRDAFKSRMARLDDSRLLSRAPLPPDEDDQEALRHINGAFEMGFAPINHDLRSGDTTVSWYRGPLVPMSYEKSVSYEDISGADAALRYTPDTGMFDASFAAAWQLGRLLALQDQAFAQALFRFRTDYQRWVRRTNAEALQQRMDDQQKKKLEELGQALDPGPDLRNMYAKTLVDAGYLGENGGSEPDPDDPPPIPDTVQNWIGQAMLLYGVPFNYLVPDAEMLPAESIRFFYLNPEWINCLLQGACSVGRTSATDELADQLLRARFFQVSEKQASELRSGAKQAATRRRTGTSANGTSATAHLSGWEETTEPVLHWPLSGYLLRSEAVAAWVGLEATAKGRDSTGQELDSLQILRMDRLAPDLLLCIYNGQVTEIEVKQPPEAVHFGAASKPEGGHEKTGLRKVKGDLETIGDRIEGTVDVPMRGQRVVDVSQLATDIKRALIDKQELEDQDPFTSAEFALEMIESPAKVIFTADETVRS